MARRRKPRNPKLPKMQPAVLDLTYRWTPATADQGAANSQDQYVDVARDLSIVNRRMYDQNRMYALSGITFIYPNAATPAAPPGVANFTLKTYSAGNTWVVQNAHTKGEALWHQMNELVLDDNPSIRGTWAGFKVHLDDHHVAANTLNPEDGDEADYLKGEWDYSTYVLPQHEVNPTTGEPLAALERTAHLVGADFSTRVGLVKAYEESRATVQPVDPSVPAGMSGSFFNLLTDSGSQEPELADVIEDANDEPPYDQDDYPGGDSNADCAVLHSQGSASAYTPTGRLPGMLLPCGLLRLQGSIIDAPVTVILHIAPGMYKGTASVPMGQ